MARLFFLGTICVALLCLCARFHLADGGVPLEPLSEISDHKEFKKILRTKTNVLILYVESTKASKALINICQEVAANVKGTGSIFLVNCGG